jgi:hypothetical protein
MDSPTDLITVCSACFRASCWQGWFMCDVACDASTIQMTRKELMDMAVEDVMYLKTDVEINAEAEEYFQ